MKRIALAAALAACVSACSGGEGADTDGDGNVSVEEAEAELAREGGQMKPDPGKYRAKMTFLNADIPNAPPEVKDMIGSAMSSTYEFCLTQEMADQGFGEALQQGQDETCKMDSLDIDGSQIDMTMSCNDPNSGSMQVTMTGNVTPTKSDLTMTSKGTFGELGDATVEMNVVQERIGECDS